MAGNERSNVMTVPAEGGRGRGTSLVQLAAGPRPALAPPALPLGLYVHIPFCVRKCHYCDFNSGPASDEIQAEYVDALEQEIRRSPWASLAARTVFFGGGTPSELSTTDLRRIVRALQETFDFSPNPQSAIRNPQSQEWTIECNPGTVSPAALAEMREMGFDRISLGVQSFHDSHLQAIGRIHSAAEAAAAVEQARAAGFQRLNLDLIFCLPGQTLDEWKSDLERGLELGPDHISLYNLTIEENTEFGRRYRSGLLSLPDEDVSADMYEWAIDRTAAAGMEQYEVSNFAHPGEECRHNQIYWRQEPYIGFGISAASYLDGVRWTNTGSMQRYLQSAAGPEGSDRAGEERLPPRAACGEAIMLGLRTREGADLAGLQKRWGMDPDREWGVEIEQFIGDGLMQRVDHRLLLTPRGVMLANAVCAAFL
jgi:oxygen-independent coproporphyrinogen-3 oxidase